MKRKLFPTDLLILLYLAFTAFLVLFFHTPSHPWGLRFTTHLFMISLLLFLVYTFPSRSPGGQTLLSVFFLFRHWYPVLGYGLIYGELEIINHYFSQGSYDEVILALEKAIFGGQPSLWFAENFQNIFLSEYFHLSYFSYYFLIPSLGATLYFKKRWKEFRLFIFSVTSGFFFCYLIFIFYPVNGPYYQFEKIGFPQAGYPFYTLTHFIIDRWDSSGTAFPSSHVAVALLVLLWSYRFERRLFVILAPFVIGLIVGTVYGRFHYAVDALAGILVGIVFYLITPFFYSLLAKNRFMEP